MPFDADDLPEPPDLELGLDDMQIETLAGDVRDAQLQRIKALTKPWAQMTQDEQNDLASGLGYDGREIVRKMVGLMTGWQVPRVVATLGDVKIIGGEKRRIEAKITASNIGDYRDALGERVGDEVLILLVDSEQFMGTKGEVQTDPDQPELPTGEAPQTEQAIRADVEAMGGLAADGLTVDGAAPGPTEEEVTAAMKRAARLTAKGEAVIDAGYLASRLSIGSTLAEAVFARMQATGLVPRAEAGGADIRDADAHFTLPGSGDERAEIADEDAAFQAHAAATLDAAE